MFAIVYVYKNHQRMMIVEWTRSGGEATGLVGRLCEEYDSHSEALRKVYIHKYVIQLMSIPGDNAATNTLAKPAQTAAVNMLVTVCSNQQNPKSSEEIRRLIVSISYCGGH